MSELAYGNDLAEAFENGRKAERERVIEIVDKMKTKLPVYLESASQVGYSAALTDLLQALRSEDEKV